jgi:hypothetical protein
MVPNSSPSNTAGSSLICAIRGPVLLITLGVLIALDFADKVSFWRTWPVLMIVFGVLKLAERLVVKNAPGGNSMRGNSI